MAEVELIALAHFKIVLMGQLLRCSNGSEESAAPADFPELIQAAGRRREQRPLEH
jgi:hypothetical protein